MGGTSKYVMCIYLMEYYAAIKMVIRRKVATWEICVLIAGGKSSVKMVDSFYSKCGLGCQSAGEVLYLCDLVTFSWKTLTGGAWFATLITQMGKLSP